MNLKIFHISDSHTYHDLIEIPKDIDCIIHSGDCSNPRDKYQNEVEVRNFIEWYSKIDVKYKIFVGGNHDTSIEHRLVTPGDFHKNGITYLENNYTTIEGFKIFGTPFTPTFGIGWSWNKDRAKMHKVWNSIDADTDIIISHGPPKTVLDLSYNREGNLEFCGDESLRKWCIINKPKLVCYGHIHNSENVRNNGLLYRDETYYSNGSIVTDGKFGKLSSNGNIINLNYGNKNL